MTPEPDMRRQPGFSIVEISIVIAAVAALAAVAVPNVMTRRIKGNEAAAVATLRKIAAAQASFQAAAHADVDRDGVGEFGFLRELSGAHGVRTSADGRKVGDILRTPELDAALSNVHENGTATFAGYHFRVSLQSRRGGTANERAAGAFYAPVDADVSESTWSAHAVPVRHGTTGRRTFFVNQTGVVVAADRGPETAMYAGSALLGTYRADNGTGLTGRLAIGTRACDTHLWSRVD